MSITQLIQNVAVLFIMMLPGLILKKGKMVGDAFGKGISNLVLYIAQPSLIVCAYLDCTLLFADIWKNILWVFLFSLLAHVIFSVVAFLFFKKEPEQKQKMLRFATIFSNAAFMGIPLIQAVCGSEAAIYASIYNITFNLFLWTLGVYLCTRVKGIDHDGDGDVDHVDELIGLHKTSKSEISLAKVLLHPVTLASVIGVLCLVFRVNRFTVELGLVWDCLSMLKGLVAPLSMVVIGLRLADIQWKGILGDRAMDWFLLLRHLLLPLAVLAIMKAVHFAGASIPTVAQDVIIIMAATPAASSATMFAEKYHCDAAYVSRLVVVSTVLCIATMPAIIGLSHMIG
ncbi:MAG: AEC family transporter [Clostridia bacterium]|nr:AEC family transporter [Clostridia bacterium]